MFSNLSEKLEKALQVLKGHGSITEINVAETLKEVRRALLDADVNFKTARDFTQRVKEKAIGQDVLTNLKPGQLMVKIVKDELAELMGGETSQINLKDKPAIVLMSGLQGSGKTTFTAKLANNIRKKKSFKPLMVACDVYRPAAIEQLHVLGKDLDIEVYSKEDSKDPVAIAKAGVKYGKSKGHNLIIIDTAGRLAIDEEMMNEISNIKKAIKPSEILFVVDSMTGQDAVNSAKAFNDVLDFDGVVLTKLDGDARGGAALSIKSVVDKPIKFIGTGEKMDALDVFHPSRMADRILGMGDVVSLVERAQQQFDQEEARKIQKKIAKNKFGLDDFMKQIQQIKKMGDMKDLVGMIPGASKMMKQSGEQVDNESFIPVEAIINSMTPKERALPSILDQSRKKRISKGSGRSVEEINQLLKQFNQMSKMMKMMQGMGKSKMMQMMQKMKGR